VRVSVTAALALILFVLAGAAGQAQVPPPPAAPSPPQAAAPAPQQLPPGPGFVSAYEITRTLRSAGFDPLAPPLREGTIYVARATDYRGILMRVVLDARTGAIRDANRILPGPGSYGGAYGEDRYGEPVGPGPYEPYDFGPPPYQAYGRVGNVPPPGGPPPDIDGPPPPAVAHPAVGASVMPLPRPRPPELAARKPADDAKPAAAVAAKASAAVDAKPDTKPDTKAAVTAAAPAASPAPSPQVVTPTPPPQAAAPTPPPQAVAPPAKPSKAPSTLTINN
jgi:hypothetical protein